jgi:hypothetical protein
MGPGRDFDSQTYPARVVADVGVQLFPLRKYRLVISSVRMARTSREKSKLVHRCFAPGGVGGFGSIGWPPGWSHKGPLRKSWYPKEAHRLFSPCRAVPGAVVPRRGAGVWMAFQPLPPGHLYRWDNAIVTGTAYWRSGGRTMKAPFRDVIRDHWGFCYGPGKYCDKARTDKWIHEPANKT